MCAYVCTHGHADGDKVQTCTCTWVSYSNGLLSLWGRRQNHHITLLSNTTLNGNDETKRWSLYWLVSTISPFKRWSFQIRPASESEMTDETVFVRKTFNHSQCGKIIDGDKVMQSLLRNLDRPHLGVLHPNVMIVSWGFCRGGVAE